MRRRGGATARRMWEPVEPVHDVVYFTPECRAAADAIGMRGFWMGYAAAAAPWAALGEDATRRLAALREPLATTVVRSGVLPPRNPVGLHPDRPGVAGKAGQR